MTTVSHLHTLYKHQLSVRLWTPISLHMDMNRFLTQWDFHRVQEHTKRSSEEEVIVVRSWRQTKQEMMHVSPRHSALCHAVAWQQLACCTLWHAVAHRSMPKAPFCPPFVLFVTKNRLGSVPFTWQPTRPNWECQISHKHGTKPTSNTFSRCMTISENNNFENKKP